MAASSPDVSIINAEWTLRLRFGALFGQLSTILVVELGLGIQVPLVPLSVLIALGLLSNGLALYFLRRRTSVPPAFLPSLMSFDVLHLTALLYFTGGPMNPFSFMYLVLIALATVVLPPRATWGLVGLSAAGSAVLFFWHRPLDWHGHGHGYGHEALDPMRTHLYGMWVAFSVAAGFIVYFLLRIRRALAQREAELSSARSLAARRDKLASLATLAAGAAHELATPLGTIAVAAKELERQLLRGRSDGTLEDVKLIRAQVARCRDVLDSLSREAGDSTGESLTAVSLAELFSLAVTELAREPSVKIQLESAADSLRLRLPLRSLSQALRALVKNALDASPPQAIVEITARREAQSLRIEISDAGPGMPPAVLERLGEPFFTTKLPGQGMGLGVFLCRAVVESLSGQLTFASAPAKGTCATVRLPIEDVAKRPRGAQPVAA